MWYKAMMNIEIGENFSFFGFLPKRLIIVVRLSGFASFLFLIGYKAMHYHL